MFDTLGFMLPGGLELLVILGGFILLAVVIVALVLLFVQKK